MEKELKMYKVLSIVLAVGFLISSICFIQSERKYELTADRLHKQNEAIANAVKQIKANEANKKELPHLDWDALLNDTK